MAHLTPFADDTATLIIGDLTLENGIQRISLSGALDVTRDKAGLALAQALKAAVDAIVDALRVDPDLPEAAPAEAATHGIRKNPFA